MKSRPSRLLSHQIESHEGANDWTASRWPGLPSTRPWTSLAWGCLLSWTNLALISKLFFVNGAETSSQPTQTLVFLWIIGFCAISDFIKIQIFLALHRLSLYDEKSTWSGFKAERQADDVLKNHFKIRFLASSIRLRWSVCRSRALFAFLTQMNNDKFSSHSTFQLTA